METPGGGLSGAGKFCSGGMGPVKETQGTLLESQDALLGGLDGGCLSREGVQSTDCTPSCRVALSLESRL